MKKIHNPKSQKKITNFKTETELRNLIITLEKNRLLYYQELCGALIKIEFEHKAKTRCVEYKLPTVKEKEDELFNIKRKNIVDDYKEKVKPIDKELYKLRIEIIERFNRTEQKRIDERLR